MLALIICRVVPVWDDCLPIIVNHVLRGATGKIPAVERALVSDFICCSGISAASRGGGYIRKSIEMGYSRSFMKRPCRCKKMGTCLSWKMIIADVLRETNGF